MRTSLFLIILAILAFAAPAWAQDPTTRAVDDMSTYTLRTTAGIAAVTTFIVMFLSRIIKDKNSPLGKVPIFVYAGVVSVGLSLISIYSGMITGDAGDIIWQTLVSAVSSHGIYEFLKGAPFHGIGDVTPKVGSEWPGKNDDDDGDGDIDINDDHNTGVFQPPHKNDTLHGGGHVSSMLLAIVLTMASTLGGCAMLGGGGEGAAQVSPNQRLIQLYNIRSTVGEELVLLRKAGFIDDDMAIRINGAIKTSDLLLQAAEAQAALGDTIALSDTIKRLNAVVDLMIEYQAQGKVKKKAKAATRPTAFNFDPWKRPTLCVLDTLRGNDAARVLV